MLLDRDLEYFIAISAHRSLSKAAAYLGVSQPTLSRSIQKLEKRLGAALLERTATGVALTAEGVLLAQRAQVAFVALEDAGREIREVAEGTRGHARIAVGASVWSLVTRALIPRLHVERPVATLEVSVMLVDQIVDVLTAGLYDFGVSVIPTEVPAELEARELVKDDLVPVVRAGHPLAAGRPRGEQLLEYPWIGVRSRLGSQNAVVTTFNALGLPAPEYIVRTDTLEIALDTVARTDFVAFAPKRLAQDRGVGQARLAVVEVPGMAYTRAVGILKRKHGHLGHISSRTLQIVEETVLGAVKP